MTSFEAYSIGLQFLHRYTRIPVTESTPDEYNETHPVPGTPVEEQPCFYTDQDRLRLDSGGRVTLSGPTLYVPPDDPISVSDQVSSVMAAGQVISEGTLTVDTVEQIASPSEVIAKVARLRGEVVR